MYDVLYPELWCLVFKDVLPYDLLNVKLTCKLFNDICVNLLYFKSCWKYTDYNNVLCGVNNSDIYNLYSSELIKSFDPRIFMKDDVIESSRLLIVSARYGDLQLFTNELKKLSFSNDLPKDECQLKINGRSCAIECAVRSGNLELIKFAFINCALPLTFTFWEYVIIEAVDTNNIDIVKYVRDFIDDSDKMTLGFIRCAINNNKILGKILFNDYQNSIRDPPIDFIEDTQKFARSLLNDKKNVIINIKVKMDGTTIPITFGDQAENHVGMQKIGKLIRIYLNHGDLYVMSSKAVGFDWKKRSIYTLRHAAGTDKSLKL